ncbi:hypothetical protein TVAG_289550 [Trichomonas vaginalis G3]|uniref:Uncharacterized protein n=1 Tax=Trichomonas vaginalis (strain ATCC PRA-98 / G3) TaxID=412133 RepID=A2G9X8_TRIV3|nr:hypothetical protein TVAGG3_0187180 [Trichomonas vaginalis G3]EAX86036.1 hypothetical protein TVAG_289550 [Trichomonas vaginalis G3]KAI5549724.1 hypothetical protein TVAGG3_0187180 [Trichomonas vaginalis G3]|eukprot:XP_001298966.1 hypothetical protein [Trichomonas vaginalis G3]
MPTATPIVMPTATPYVKPTETKTIAPSEGEKGNIIAKSKQAPIIIGSIIGVVALIAIVAVVGIIIHRKLKHCNYKEEISDDFGAVDI